MSKQEFTTASALLEDLAPRIGGGRYMAFATRIRRGDPRVIADLRDFLAMKGRWAA